MMQDRPTLLVVDDEEDIRESIALIVSSEFHCLHSSNGLEAVRLIEKSNVDLIITDYNMPGLDGLQLIKTLHEGGVRVPTVVLTGRGSQELNRDTLAFSAYEYLEKPFRPDELREILRKCLSFLPDPDYKTMEEFYEDFHLKVPKQSAQFIQNYAHRQGMSVGTLFEKFAFFLEKGSKKSG